MPSALISKEHSYPAFTPGGIAGTLAVPLSRSSRTRDSLPSRILTPTVDRDRTVSRRSEPSSRTTLTGEQPDPWELLHPQDVMHISPLLLVVQTISSPLILYVKGFGV